MKKLLLFLLTLPLLIACNSNNPSLTNDKDFLPKLCDQLYMANVDDAILMLKKKGIDVTPFEAASPDSIVLEGDWGMLSLAYSGTDERVISSVRGFAPMPADDKYTLFDQFKSWEKYADKLNETPYLWFGTLQTADTLHYFEDGQIMAFAKTMMDMALSSGKLTQQEYDEYMGEMRNHDEFDSLLREISNVVSALGEYLNLDTEMSVIELMMNQDALMNLKGKSITIAYYNAELAEVEETSTLAYIVEHVDMSEYASYLQAPGRRVVAKVASLK